MDLFFQKKKKVSADESRPQKPVVFLSAQLEVFSVQKPPSS
jgi:hypothetical protein